MSENRNGGYHILDLHGVALTDEKATVKGIYDAVEGAVKPILLTGVNVGAINIAPLFVTAVPGYLVNDKLDTEFVLDAGCLLFIVSDDDGITVTIKDPVPTPPEP